MPRRGLVLLSLLVLLVSLPRRALADVGLGVGLDGGPSWVSPTRRPVDPVARVSPKKPPVGLGIDIGGRGGRP